MKISQSQCLVPSRENGTQETLDESYCSASPSRWGFYGIDALSVRADGGSDRNRDFITSEPHLDIQHGGGQGFQD